MKKTILSITILSFTFLSLHVHTHEHEHDHADHADHASDYNTVEEDCGFCLFNSLDSFAETSTISANINFKNIVYKLHVSNYISYSVFCFLNKSPPQ